MIIENSNIDKLFRAGLRDIEVNPPVNVWEGIKSSIQTGKKKIPVIYYMAAASLAFFILAGSALLFFRSKPDELAENVKPYQEQQANLIKPNPVAPTQKTLPEKSDLSTENQQITELGPEKTLPALKLTQLESISTQVDNQEVQNITDLSVPGLFQISGQNKTDTESETGISFGEKPARLTQITPFNIYKPLKVNYSLALRQAKEEESYSGYLTESENTELITNISHWSVGGQFSPVYTFRDIIQSRSEDLKEFYNNLEDALLAFSGGVNVQFTPRNRLSIHSGIYYSRMGQRINEILFYPNGSVANQEGVYIIKNSTGDIESTLPDVTFADKKNNRVFPFIEPRQLPNLNPVNADIVQNFEYLEIPLIFKYKLIDKKMDFQLLGGFSTNFLMGNKAFVWHDNEKIPIGKTTDIYTFNFSSTFGFSFEYGLSNKLSLNLEPTFKYYLNSVNKRALLRTHPYSIGIFSGLSYDF